MMLAILVIDDEVRLAKNIQAYLQHFDFDVRKSENGLQGLEEFERFKPDVVLLDLKLPDINGLEVLKRLRNLDAAAKVIMITGTANGKIKAAAIKAGALEYLTKPLVLKDLKLLIDKVAA